MKPTVGSLFSGIGGFDLGLERAGWEVRWQVENNPFRQKILKRHWPDVELRSDIITDTDGLERVDLVAGGFPCQDLSVAGNRAGLAGERSGLFFQFMRVVGTLQPRWVLIENVPGLLSSNQGRDFGVVLNTLAELGFWWTYRVLDSKFWGVAQRRRRVYIVGHLGGPCPPEILFEPDSLRRDSKAGREAGQEVAGSLGGGSGKRGWTDDLDRSEAFIPERSHAIVGKGNEQDGTINTYIVNARQDPVVGKQPLDTDGHSLAVAVRTAQTSSNGWGVDTDGLAYTLDGAEGQAIVQPLDVAYALRSGRGRFPDSNGTIGNVAIAKTLLGSGGFDGSPDPDRHSLVVSPPPDANGVREASGIPGFVDDATPDGHRYAALGDAVTVPVIEWIGRRILKAHYGET